MFGQNTFTSFAGATCPLSYLPLIVHSATAVHSLFYFTSNIFSALTEQTAINKNIFIDL